MLEIANFKDWIIVSSLAYLNIRTYNNIGIKNSKLNILTYLNFMA